MFRTIFVQPDPATVSASWDEVRGQLAGRFPKIGTPDGQGEDRVARVHRERRYLCDGSMAQLNPTSDTDTTAAIDSGA